LRWNTAVFSYCLQLELSVIFVHVSEDVDCWNRKIWNVRLAIQFRSCNCLSCNWWHV